MSLSFSPIDGKKGQDFVLLFSGDNRNRTGGWRIREI